MSWLSLGRLAELSWGLEVFVVVTATLIVRYLAMRLLKVLSRHLQKTQNVWDDALLEAARRPLSYFILIFGVAWIIEISDGYFQTELFSPENLGADNPSQIRKIPRKSKFERHVGPELAG